MKKYKDVTCRGSYVLGSACGHCERCADERLKLTEESRLKKEQGCRHEFDLDKSICILCGKTISSLLLEDLNSLEIKTGYWHDPLKELPKEEGHYLVYIKYFNYEKYSIYHWTPGTSEKSGWDRSGRAHLKEIFAWGELPPKPVFEEDRKAIICDCGNLIDKPINRNPNVELPYGAWDIYYCFNCGLAYRDSGDGGSWVVHNQVKKEKNNE